MVSFNCQHNLELPGKQVPMKDYLNQVGLGICLWKTVLIILIDMARLRPTINGSIPQIWALGFLRVERARWVVGMYAFIYSVPLTRD